MIGHVCECFSSSWLATPRASSTPAGSVRRKLIPRPLTWIDPTRSRRSHMRLIYPSKARGPIYTTVT
eukprot:545537-Lingulodinium_polyedra.AAC.1